MNLKNLRLSEFSLLATASAAALLALLTVSLARNGQVTREYVFPGVTTVAAFGAAHVFLTARRFRGDQIMLGTTAMLTSIGLAIVMRLEPELGIRQSVWVLLGIAVFLVVLAFPRPILWLKRYKYTWAILGLSLLVATLLFGKDPNQSGARLWLGFNGAYFQPSEVQKVLLVIFLAAYLDEKREMLSEGVYRLGRLRLLPLPYLGPMLVVWGLAVMILFGQRDMGPTFLLFGVFVAMLYVGTARSIYVAAGLILFAVAVFLAVKFVPLAAVRFEVWRDPFLDPQGHGYQIIQGLVAIANGGILGAGFGFGRPDLIPAAYTDFPFAALAEETGMAGALGVLALYLVLIYRGLRVALDTRESFQQLLAAGLTTVLALQTLIIVGGNLRLIPLTGITLPFVSYGGSSLLANFLIIGLLMRISNDTNARHARP